MVRCVLEGVHNPGVVRRHVFVVVSTISTSVNLILYYIMTVLQAMTKNLISKM